GTVWWSRLQSAPVPAPTTSVAGVSDPGPATAPARVARTGPTMFVVDRGGPTTTLAAALGVARPGDRIILRGPVWEEAVRLTGNTGRGVRVEGDGAAPVVWKAPEGHDPSRPLLDVTAVEGLTVANVAFDGDGRVADLVRVHG